MPLRYEQILRILEDYGFVLDRQNGSHKRYQKGELGVTVGFHKEFPPRTAKSMLQSIADIVGINVKILIKKYSIKV
ncbi:MAG: type II toxin-antitoxin system HicA family toxin [Candidatus Absconditabacterales bacterium]